MNQEPLYEFFWPEIFALGRYLEIERKKVPILITETLEALGQPYQWSATRIHEAKLSIVKILENRGQQEVLDYLFPHGAYHEEYEYNIQWHIALGSMVMRRALKKQGLPAEAWTLEGFKRDYMHPKSILR